MKKNQHLLKLPDHIDTTRSWKEKDTIAEYEFRQHPLVKAARYLMQQAEKDIRFRVLSKYRFDKCTCGHRRQWHLPEYDGSGNYSQGICKECKCNHFLQAQKAEIKDGKVIYL